MSIVIDTSIPAGNAALIDVQHHAKRAVVRFTADPCGGPEALWFCFRVRSGSSSAGSRQVDLVLTHRENLLGAGRPEGLRPVIRYARGQWQRLPAPGVVPLADGRCEYLWQVQSPRSWFDVALCYPYGLAELNSLTKDTAAVLRADVIGVSQGARPLVRLSNGGGEPESDRPGVYIVARQHSGETPGSWVLDGMLRRLAQRDDAPLVWAVPLSNIDGVETGAYGKDNFPYDLNRAWGRPPMRHETLVIQRDISRWRQRCRPMLALDFHAPGGTETSGIYTFVPQPDKANPLVRCVGEWANHFQDALAPTYVHGEFARTANYPSRWETFNFTRYAVQTAEVPALTFECSYAMAGDLVLDIDRYRTIGALLADAVCDHTPSAFGYGAKRGPLASTNAGKPRTRRLSRPRK
jgi:hypothetical protein